MLCAACADIKRTAFLRLRGPGERIRHGGDFAAVRAADNSVFKSEIAVFGGVYSFDTAFLKGIGRNVRYPA